MFDQFDLLSIPAAGLQALDPMELSPLSQGSDTVESDQFHTQTDSEPSLFPDGPKCLVRAYGGELEM
jgi:hypothetical protein